VSARARLRTIADLDLQGRRLFLRSDLNVPLRDRAVADDTRIRASQETLAWAREHGARVVLASHLGRPRGERRAELSLRPVADALGIPLAPDCIGADTEARVEALRPGEALLLENLRFHTGEEKNDAAFAAALARLTDVYVNDAFGTAHRAHTSTEGLPRRVPEVAAGFLLAREIEALTRVRDEPGRPYLCILGGAKVSDKLSDAPSSSPIWWTKPAASSRARPTSSCRETTSSRRAPMTPGARAAWSGSRTMRRPSTSAPPA
jgi:phosphoglycerate kinase